MPLVHDELRRIARRCLYGERANHSVQATELVNEAFLRLVDVQRPDHAYDCSGTVSFATSSTSTGRTGRISWRCRRG